MARVAEDPCYLLRASATPGNGDAFGGFNQTLSTSAGTGADPQIHLALRLNCKGRDRTTPEGVARTVQPSFRDPALKFSRPHFAIGHAKRGYMTDKSSRINTQYGMGVS